MRTRIDRNLKRVLSICVVLALLLSAIGSHGTVVYAAETSFDVATLALNSNTVDDASIELYVKDTVHYILIEDLCELVRCSWTEKDDVIWVTQGFWSATFNVKDQVFDDGYQTVDITILEVEPNKYAVPALMFLNYFKAAAFIENDTLYCEMPEFTAWEALNVDYANTLVDIYELYGGEGNVALSLTLDIIMDFIMGDMSTSEDYLSDAFLTALKVDLYDYDSVQKYKETSQEGLYSFLHSDKGEEFVEAVDDVLSVSAEPTQWYIQYYYNSIEKSFVNLAYDAFEAGQHTDVTHYGEKFYEAFTEKNKTSETAEKYFDNSDYVMLFVSAAVDTAQQMKYTNATDNLIYNVMGQDNLNYLGISPSEDNGWFTVANRYKNVLGVAATQLEAEAMQLFTDQLCWETLIGTGVSSASGISGGAWSFSLNFARLFVEKFPLTSSSVEAFKADRRALFLSELQQNVYWVALNTLDNMQGQWDNLEIYAKYIQALQLYCRTSIAMYENLIAMNDEFGGSKEYWRSLFQNRIDMLAVSLYQLTTFQDDGVAKCLPLVLTSFDHAPTETNKKQLSSITTYVNGTEAEEYHFTYNDIGQVIRLVAYRYEDENAIKWYTQNYEYDEKENLVLVEHGSSQSYHYQYDYDADGRITGYSTIEYYEDSPGPSDTYIFSYDNQGRVVERRNEYGSSVEEFSYDESEKTVYESSELYWGDGHFIETTVYDYTYEPLVITTHTSESKEYGNSSSKSISFKPHWNLTVASGTIGDSCSFDVDSSGYLLRVIDENGDNVYVCNYQEAKNEDSNSEFPSSNSANQLVAATYIPAIERVASNDLCSNICGFLFDLDGDKTDELVLYYGLREEYYAIPIHTFDVYDVENGQLVTRLEKIDIGSADVGGSSGNIGVEYHNRTPVIATYARNGWSSPGYYVFDASYEITLYDCHTYSSIRSISVDVDEHDSGYTITHVIDGAELSEDSFHQEIAQYKRIFLDDFDSYSYVSWNYKTTGESFEQKLTVYDLLRYLQQTAKIAPESPPVLMQDDAEEIAYSIWGEYLERTQGFDWKIFEEHSIIKNGIEYYCYTLNTNSRYGEEDWSIHNYLFVNSVSGEYDHTLF